MFTWIYILPSFLVNNTNKDTFEEGCLTLKYDGINSMKTHVSEIEPSLVIICHMMYNQK